MKCRMTCWLLGCMLLVVVKLSIATAADDVNRPLGDPGELPKADDGRALNLDFERGTLDDWTAEGKAFQQQPIKGPLDQKRPLGAGKASEHTGDYWVGGFEKLFDEPQGTLTSVPFKVTHPYASFLVGAGSSKQTRVDLVNAADNKVFFTASGQDQENLRPVVVDLRPLKDKKIYIRVVDEHSGGWGHVNFDDFRFHKAQPKFTYPVQGAPAPAAEQLYPFAGLDPEAAAKAMRLPAGFRVQVAAGEPDVKQPIAMAIDDRGRLWVCEAYEYPIRAAEGKGNDRILVLEDTNCDGRLDKRTVFAENLNLVSGIEVGFGGVWVGAAPYLLFFPDANGDDVPDAEPQVLLDGWAYQDTHEMLNTFAWGPDGWLYGCHGVFTHSKVGKPGTPEAERTPINAGIWRYHPTQHRFEVFAEGTSNPWGIDFNDHGQAFCTACVIPHLFHIIHGARYERQAGTFFSPYVYEGIKTIADHLHYSGNQWNDLNRRQSDELGGGHAHAGASIYLGGAWPERYRNQLFMNNIHGNRINQDLLKSSGSGYVGSHGPDFIYTLDQWSQILNLQYGPDGQMWMLDWYDRTQCHLNDPAAHDRTNGRIFRVSYNDAKPVALDLAKSTDAKLVELQTDNNEWNVRHARRILQERAAAGKLDPSAREALTKLALGHAEDTRRLRGLWALHVTGGVPAELSAQLLKDKSPHVRGWVVQLLVEPGGQPLSAEMLAQFTKIAKEDDSPVVRLDLASTLQRMPPAQRWPILSALVAHGEDATDHNLPLMYWYAAEPLAEVDPSRALALALSARDKMPQLVEFMVRRIGAGEPEKSLSVLVAGLADAKDESLQLTYLRGLNSSLQGKREIKAPQAWAALYPRVAASNNAAIRLQGAALGLTLGDAAAAGTLRKWATETATPVELRRQALGFLVKAKDAETAQVLQKLLTNAELRGDALRALAAFDDPATPAAILAVYDGLPPAAKVDALGTLCARPQYARALLAAVDKKQIPSAQLTADLIRQLRNLNDSELNSQIEQVWGVVRDTPQDKAEQIAQYKKMLTAGALQPDVERGRAIFAKTCQQCHTLFGSGGKVGPDLTGSNRANLDYLLSNVIDPSAVVAKDYQATILQTADGRILTGIAKPGDGDTIVVQTANETVTVPRGDIEDQKLSDKSMMPDDQLKPMSPLDIASLVAYLASTGQSPLLATADNVPSFFNGKDLTLWRGDEALWSVENGEIVGRTAGLQHNAFLVSEMSMDDFRLSVDVLLVKNEGNSGIQLRSRPLPGGEVKGYQADIGVGWWGKIYEEEGRGLLWDKSGEQFVKPGEWNKYEIVAVGSRVRTWLNGQACADLDDPQAARRGVIALQLHSGGPTEVRFRNFKLELIGKPSAAVGAYPASKSADGAVKFKRHSLDPIFRSEGVGYGDFNNDGRLDIAAGSVWYEAPDWKMHTLLDKPHEFSPRTYSDTFCNWAEDLNNDGRQDLIVVDFPGKQTWWFENPGPAGGQWKRHQVVPVTNNESPAYLDVDGDGRRELIFGYAGQRMGLARPTESADADWAVSAISKAASPGTDQFSHGLGLGDMNADGRLDVVVPQGWWEQPAVGGRGAWQFHAAALGEPAAQMYVFDFDGDGDADVVSSSAHRTGIWWHEQTKDGWKTHEIDNTFAQTHSMCMADMNGDGLPDFVTGKRHFAHNGNDPGEDKPAVLFWYELSRKDGKPVWTPHEIDHDSGVGTQFEVVDLGGDGLLDVIVSNKKGTHYFEQVRKPSASAAGR